MARTEIILSKNRMEFVRNYAEKRYEQARSRGVQNYGRIGGEGRETGVDAHIHGMLAEAAFVDFYGEENLRWNYYVDGSSTKLSGLPEIEIAGVSVDAKGISKSHLSLLVQAGTAKSDWVYVLVDVGRAPICNLLVWMIGHEVLRVPLSEPQAGRPAHLIRQGDPRMREFGSLADFLGVAPKACPDEPVRNKLFGHCACGAPGLYFAFSKWHCQEHRPTFHAVNTA